MHSYGQSDFTTFAPFWMFFRVQYPRIFVVKVNEIKIWKRKKRRNYLKTGNGNVSQTFEKKICCEMD